MSLGQAAACGEAEQLQREGYCVVRGAISPETCDALREHVLLSTDEAARLGRNDLFGNIQEATQRYDLKLDLCPPVASALNSLFAKCGPMLAEIMGPRIRLVELAAITSDGGAVAQPVHADTMHGVTRFLQSDISMPNDTPVSDDEDAADDLGEIVRAVATDTSLIYTHLIALQDISPDMGPTHVWPGTNTVEHHATLWGTHVGGKLNVAEADTAFGVEHRKMTLSKGDLVLYDSRTMHCGGANSSGARRSVFCVSVMGPGIRPDGTTWTMLKSLRHRLLLSDFPMSSSLATAPVATAGDAAAALPPPQPTPGDLGGSKEAGEGKADAEEGRPIPPLEEWEAAVQCSWCRKWRPCSAAEAPRLTSSDSGFLCKNVGFTCTQEQRYSSQEIDAAF